MAQPQEFFAWFSAQADMLQSRPWLVLGKGPTFSRLKDEDVSGYFLVGLNHVVRETPVKLAHAIDIDVIASCEAVLERNAEYVVMPWRPHVDNRPGERTLADWIGQMPVLQRLSDAGRLLWYNASTSAARSGFTVVPVKYFSVEAAINLLAMAGVRRIRSLGVDGGATYSSEFSGVGTLLANGRGSFNKQFTQIAAAILEHGLDYAPLGVDVPVKVFVAATDAQMLAVKVLEYSIRKNASLTVDIIPLQQVGIDIPQPRDKKNWPRTPFSFQRFLIPQACSFQGRAIYLDSDMQVFTDIRELWDIPLEGNALLSARDAREGGRKPQYSVMLLNCAALDWNINAIVSSLDEGRLSYEGLMYNMAVAGRQEALIPAEWNSLEHYKEGQTRLLHYTDMDTQPWVYTNNPHGYLWCRDLFEAIRTGHVGLDMLDEHIARGWVRPSLRYQFDHNIADPLLLPRSILKRDEAFQAPFLGIHSHHAKPWRSLKGMLLGLFRRLYLLTPLPKLSRKISAFIHRYD